jgi:hypothetical protein
MDKAYNVIKIAASAARRAPACAARARRRCRYCLGGSGFLVVILMTPSPPRAP